MLSFCLVRSSTSRWVAARKAFGISVDLAEQLLGLGLGLASDLVGVPFSALPTSCLACWSASRRVWSGPGRWPSLPAAPAVEARLLGFEHEFSASQTGRQERAISASWRSALFPACRELDLELGFRLGPAGPRSPPGSAAHGWRISSGLALGRWLRISSRLALSPSPSAGATSRSVLVRSLAISPSGRGHCLLGDLVAGRWHAAWRPSRLGRGGQLAGLAPGR